ncbi:hypothetical protein CYMTET_12509 [Cymbomonas tetramitiformis]|uniref:Uncharacterized protein n=1 Tax=Cymbomonas tetramitiformis TaxID=36881 RepID=A0AAE0LC38_9CHLO|nr:hypothetical protein CYMTET_12509 [Cymbomonas tetramitiformis]
MARVAEVSAAVRRRYSRTGVQEQSGASSEQAMALAEGGVATLMGASRRMAGLLGGVAGMVRVTREMWGGSRVELTHAGPLRARGPISAAMTTYNSEQLSGRRRPDGELSATVRAWDTQATVGMGPQVGTVVGQVWSTLLKFAASSQGIQCKGFSHMDLVLGVEGCRRKSGAQVRMRAAQFIILSPLGQPLGTALGDSGRGGGGQALLRPGSRAGRGQRDGPECGLGGEEVARVAELSRLQRHCSSVLAGQSQRGSGGPVRLREQRSGPARRLAWWRYGSHSSGGRDEPASGTRQQCASGADAEGLGWLSEA